MARASFVQTFLFFPSFLSAAALPSWVPAALLDSIAALRRLICTRCGGGGGGHSRTLRNLPPLHTLAFPFLLRSRYPRGPERAYVCLFAPCHKQNASATAALSANQLDMSKHPPTSPCCCFLPQAHGSAAGRSESQICSFICHRPTCKWHHRCRRLLSGGGGADDGGGGFSGGTNSIP